MREKQRYKNYFISLVERANGVKKREGLPGEELQYYKDESKSPFIPSSRSTRSSNLHWENIWIEFSTGPSRIRDSG